MYSNSNEIFKFLSQKRIVGVLIKWKRNFYTDVENFQKPLDAGLIGVFAKTERLIGKFTNKQLDHFDHIIWFETNYDTFKPAAENYWDYNNIKIPGLEQAIDEIVEKLEKTKIRLIAGEEVTIQPTAVLREKHGITGAKPADLHHIRNKGAMKDLAVNNDIAGAKDYHLEITQALSIDTTISAIENQLLYPVFVKPVLSAGGAGSIKITNRLSLKHWLHLVKNSLTPLQSAGFLVEQYYGEPEFWVSVVLLPDGNYKINQLLYVPFETTQESVENGNPMCFFTAKPEDAETVVPGVLEFVNKVLDAFKPPAPYVVGIEGFHVKSSDQLILRELAYRIYGHRGTGTSYYCSGISLETAFLSVHLDPEYQATPQADRPELFVATLWYPFVNGVLKDKNPLPMEEISSVIKVYWFVDIGEKMKKTGDISDNICYVMVLNRNKKKCWKDAKFIAESYRPNIS